MSVAMFPRSLLLGELTTRFHTTQHTSASFWTGLRVQPILSDEVQTFKALITVHKLLQEGHPIVRCASGSQADPGADDGLARRTQTLKEGQNQAGWLETCARTVGGDVSRGGLPCTGLRDEAELTTRHPGYGALIRAYVTLILAKLKFHKIHPDFNGLFEYEEYVSLRGVDDPNEG